MKLQQERMVISSRPADVVSLVIFCYPLWIFIGRRLWIGGGGERTEWAILARYGLPHIPWSDPIAGSSDRLVIGASCPLGSADSP
jgi:hypothetical protein